MSIKSFLTKIWGTIQSLFNSIPSEIQSAVHIAVMLTENIKKFIDSPIADVLTAIIPGDIDDKIKQSLRSGLPVILSNLKLADECGNLSDPEEITKCAINTLQKLDGGLKSVYLHALSVLLTQITADGKLSWSDGVCVVEWYYKNKFKPTER
ncbi:MULTISPECIES: hypothetical protein [unclassified Mucilaginibacter]|uniref:hypothetical protein n=1 Tax=unclassified Mucilaginibacter TaxID=2617802 RepID=UPI002AC96AD9|nr:MULTISPECIES: hypothetical protein [unclassified Mucilaginibacter]MEB0262669.1 hypothetical protein [Mucilaginibacter sp. 10I4]MEB0280623.1 hypothetical protein [Mucilaginibacter sp. 10B2]MEB0300296.1 hypothetical protein [Mucilaginibacter sp. 5C4]WPX24959.1 hypothetical protein RHM67_06750 [Mucilaginibacter sp. 5C4]